MVTVFIPPQLRTRTGGVKKLELDAESVRSVVDQLEERFPGVRERLCEGDSLRPGLAVSVAGSFSPLGLLQKIPDGAEVHFVPELGGG